ncbi:unnamed protein product [Spirodela intermedia]|uniref:Uncharacterized protein n=2 Tax=Spirodela intermedia TaxID=51605 RepID=A0A7I8LA82_SPIIN|nr:unnamed protein product [Spirodela intermedia]
MKWVVESSPAAVTRRSGKTATLRLSGGSMSKGLKWLRTTWGMCASLPFHVTNGQSNMGQGVVIHM